MGDQRKNFQSIEESIEDRSVSSKIFFLQQFILLSIVAIIFGLFLSGCHQNGTVVGAPVLLVPTLNTAESTGLQTIQSNPRKSEKAIPKSKLVTVIENVVTDVLIVIDNSASMRFEQANMAARFGSLLDEMRGMDWRLAIITTDVSADGPKKDGRLLEFKTIPGNYFLSSEMPEDQVKEAFASTIQRPSREGSANEQAIKATYRSIEREQKWLRDIGSFNVVAVSDSDETPAKGSKPDARNNPSVLMSYVSTKYPNKPFYFHSIIVQENDEECLKGSDNESYGRNYAWLSEQTGGVIGNVCEEDYSKQLKMIGEKVSQKVKLVDLECIPVANSVSVRNDRGYDIPTFEVLENTIHFKEPLPQGHNTINYSCPSALEVAE